MDGTLTVNYEQVDTEYRLRHNDLLANIVHRSAPAPARPLLLNSTGHTTNGQIATLILNLSDDCCKIIY